MKLLLLIASFVIVSCGANEQESRAPTKNASSYNAELASLPKEMQLLASINTALELHFLSSDKLQELEQVSVDQIIAFHAQDFFKDFDLDNDGRFSQVEILEAFNESAKRVYLELEDQKANYNSNKQTLDQNHLALHQAHQSGNMQLVDSLLGGFFGGGLGNIAGSIIGILSNIIFPGSSGSSTRSSSEDGNTAHEAYEALSQLKKLLLELNKVLTELDHTRSCLEGNSSCDIEKQIDHWSKDIELEIANSALLEELGY